MPKLFWRVADQFVYLRTLTRLRILDALAGPLPETEADRQREREWIESRDQPSLAMKLGK
jgi:hypothetical protein